MLGEPDWNSMNFPKVLWILAGIPGKPLKVFQILEFRKILNQQGLESGINCYYLSWKSWNFYVPKSVSFIAGVWILSGITQYQSVFQGKAHNDDFYYQVTEFYEGGHKLGEKLKFSFLKFYESSELEHCQWKGRESVRHKFRGVKVLGLSASSDFQKLSFITFWGGGKNLPWHLDNINLLSLRLINRTILPVASTRNRKILKLMAQLMTESARSKKHPAISLFIHLNFYTVVMNSQGSFFGYMILT